MLSNAWNPSALCYRSVKWSSSCVYSTRCRCWGPEPTQTLLKVNEGLSRALQLLHWLFHLKKASQIHHNNATWSSVLTFCTAQTAALSQFQNLPRNKKQQAEINKIKKKLKNVEMKIFFHCVVKPQRHGLKKKMLKLPKCYCFSSGKSIFMFEWCLSRGMSYTWVW